MCGNTLQSSDETNSEPIIFEGEELDYYNSFQRGFLVWSLRYGNVRDHLSPHFA
jgi:hypothetical protein